jgi:DNA-binding Xre family transcriptional regulator
VVGSLAAAGRASSTRRDYVQVFKGFHRFLEVRKAAEISALFGVRLVCPVDEFNASRHVGDDSPALLPPPTPERVEEFFGFLKTRIATARKYAPAARDYAIFRTLYHAGLRSEESVKLDAGDVHYRRGPFGKLHVRFGKGAHTSGPRPRWVPMLDGLETVLALVPARCARPVPGLAGAVPGRVRRPDAPGNGTQPSSIPDDIGRAGPVRLVQPARPSPGVRDPQLRARHGPGGDSADARALDCLVHYAIRPALRDLHRRGLPAGDRPHPDRAEQGRRVRMRINWKLRMAAAQRGVWTGTDLGRLLEDKAGLELSSASLSALFTKQPTQVKLSTLIALCTALECTPNDLFEIDTTPVARPATPTVPLAKAVGSSTPSAPRGRSLPPM